MDSGGHRNWKWIATSAGWFFFAMAYPMEQKSFAGAAFHQLFSDYGMSKLVSFDGVVEKQVKPKTKFMKQVRKCRINCHISEPYWPQQNREETVTQEVKKQWFSQMVKQKLPK